MTRIIPAVLTLILSSPAFAQVELNLAQSRIRATLAGQASPSGVPAPEFEASAVPEPPYKGADFTLKDPAGKDHKLSALKGQYVLLVFSATWCGPCKQAIPKFEALKAKYAKKGGVTILAVYSEDGDTVAAHKKEKGASYSAVLDPGSEIGSRYGVRAFPTVFVIAPDGARSGPFMGVAGAEKAIAKIEAALGRP